MVSSGLKLVNSGLLRQRRKPIYRSIFVMIERHEFGIVIVAFSTRDFFVITVILSGSLLMNSPVLEKDDVMWYVGTRSI